MRELHAEVALLGGLVWGKSRIDGLDYRNPVLLMDANIGYRLGFFEPGGLLDRHAGALGFYVLPQLGVIQGLYSAIGPRGGKGDTFLQAKLLVWLSF